MLQLEIIVKIKLIWRSYNFSRIVAGLYCFKLIKHGVSSYFTNHDAISEVKLEKQHLNSGWNYKQGKQKSKGKLNHKVNKCFCVPNISRLRNDSFTHILSSLRFLNGNWHKITAWQMQTINGSLQQNSGRLVDAIRVLYYWTKKSVVDFISLFFLSSLLQSRVLCYNCAICRWNCADVYRLLDYFTPIHTESRKGHIHSPTPSQKKVMAAHTHPQSAKKWSHPAKKGHTYPHITEKGNVTCLTHIYVKSIPFLQY